MLRKIKINQLKVGMHLAETSFSWIDYPWLYNGSGEIQSEEEIKDITASGFREVFIDTSRGSYDGPLVQFNSEDAVVALQQEDSGQEESTPEASPLDEELAEITPIYEESIDYARKFMVDARMGKRIEVEESKHFVGQLVASLSRNLDALLALIKLRSCDEYTYGHCINVTVLTLAFGQYLGMPEEQMAELGSAALYHDVGKASIPDEVLNKPGKLTDQEFETIKNHTLLGFKTLKDSSELPVSVLRGVVEHHEKANGRGYPKGLVGDKISRYAALIQVADVYDALTSERVYKQAILPAKALSIMYGSREDFQPEFVERFIKCLGIYPVGSMVRLSSGDYAVVAATNAGKPLLPKVKVVFNKNLEPRRPRMLDLARLNEDESALNIEEAFDHAAHGIDPMPYLL